MLKSTFHRLSSADLLREILISVNAATIYELALHLDPQAFVLSESGFACPMCSQTAARIRSAYAWSCGECGKDSTIFELRRLVLERPAPLSSLCHGGQV